MIAAEGFWYVFIPLCCFTGSGFLAIWRKKAGWFVPAGFFFLIWLAMLFFFRDPARPQPDIHAIVAVSDGTVDQIVTLPDGRTRIEVWLTLLNVHALRSPMSGTVTRYQFIPGRFIPVEDRESSEVNQRVTVEMSTELGLVQFSAISGSIARRVVMPVSPGDSLLAGQRIGIIRFGSRSELVLPRGVRPVVRPGDPVVAGVTVIAEQDPDANEIVPPEEGGNEA